MKIIYLIYIQIQITISYFQMILTATKKKNEIDSENNGQNRMVPLPTNWLP